MPLKSSTFKVYQNIYQKTWKDCLFSDFFEKWTILIINKRASDAAKELLQLFFIKGFKSDEEKTSLELKSLILDKNLKLKMKYLYDKIRFGVYRHLGKYENYRSIK